MSVLSWITARSGGSEGGGNGVGGRPGGEGCRADDLEGICRFGEAHIRPHYAPLIGETAADEQVRRWWNETYVRAAVAKGLVVVAEADGEVVGVGQRGRNGADHVEYKLYVHPQHRGRGIGPQVIDALIRQLPTDADRLYIEQFAGNERAGEFYEREGFAVERIEPGPTEALAVVWRVCQVSSVEAQSSSAPESSLSAELSAMRDEERY